MTRTIWDGEWHYRGEEDWDPRLPDEPRKCHNAWLHLERRHIRCFCCKGKWVL